MSYTSLRDFLMAECFIHAMSLVMCRRQAVLEAGSLTPQLHTIMDLDWYVRLLEKGLFVYVPDKLAEIRIHSGNLTQQQVKWLREEMDWLVRMRGSRRLRAYRYLFHSARAARRQDFWLGARCALHSALLSPLTALAVSWKKWGRRPDPQQELGQLRKLGLLIDA